MWHLIWNSNLVHLKTCPSIVMKVYILLILDIRINCVNFDVRSTNLQKSFNSFYVLYFILRNNPIFKVSICAESAFFSFFTTTTAKLANAFSESKNTAIPPKKNHKIENVSHWNTLNRNIPEGVLSYVEESLSKHFDRCVTKANFAI